MTKFAYSYVIGANLPVFNEARRKEMGFTKLVCNDRENKMKLYMHPISERLAFFEVVK